MSFMGYGATATGHSRNDSSSSKQPSLETMRVLTVAPTVDVPMTSRTRYEYPQGNSPETMISADGLVPVSGMRNRNSSGVGVDEKTTLLNDSINGQQGFAPNDGHHAHDHDDHHHHHECFHGPGERCSLPHSIQPLISPMNHAAVENVVIKVMDGAEVTQKTIFYFWDEWKHFINRGNVIDLGIGVVIGGAFSDIIDSIVADILTPPLSLWAAGTNLENSFIVLRHGRTPGKIYATYLEAQADGAVTENTGHFLKACLNFFIIAFFLFWIVKALHNIRQEKIKPPPKEKTCNWCRESIHLDAFRCKYCHSYVKDIPGVEDAGVGMFVTIKKPKPQQQQQQQKPRTSHDLPPLPQEHIAANDVALAEKAAAQASTVSLEPKCSSSPTSTLGPSNGKKVAEDLAKMNNQ